MNPISLRPLAESDLPLLHDWLGRPHVVEWWGDVPSLDEVKVQCHPTALAEEAISAFIAMHDDRPVGFAQVYVAMGSGEGWWEGESDPGVRGLDLFLADGSQLGRGLGTQVVRQVVESLFSNPAVTKIQVDPSPDNARAIRCFEKAGFVSKGRITTPDGPAIYMTAERPR